MHVIATVRLAAALSELINNDEWPLNAQKQDGTKYRFFPLALSSYPSPYTDLFKPNAPLVNCYRTGRYICSGALYITSICSSGKS